MTEARQELKAEAAELAATYARVLQMRDDAKTRSLDAYDKYNEARKLLFEVKKLGYRQENLGRIMDDEFKNAMERLEKKKSDAAAQSSDDEASPLVFILRPKAPVTPKSAPTSTQPRSVSTKASNPQQTAVPNRSPDKRSSEGSPEEQPALKRTKSGSGLVSTSCLARHLIPGLIVWVVSSTSTWHFPYRSTARTKLSSSTAFGP